MKALSTAILEGVVTFVKYVFIFCIGMAALSYFVEISEETYKYFGWYLPAAAGLARFLGYLLNNKDKKDSQG